MKTIAGFKNVVDAAKAVSNVPIQKKVETKPVFSKPARPEGELFSDSLRKR